MTVIGAGEAPLLCKEILEEPPPQAIGLGMQASDADAVLQPTLEVTEPPPLWQPAATLALPTGVTRGEFDGKMPVDEVAGELTKRLTL
mmetsp:Transcript_29805/g.54292  ORF Transcript_29805/g.54292 Transcript_29805/m.54292 type:complete len:88 (-) Transcript_29805:121-384(-)